MNQYSHHPKIGIRPVVDGRRNLTYEAVCQQTQKVADLAAQLFTTKLRYPDGAPVECCVYPEPIYGAAGAARCSQYFAARNVGAILSVSTCWCFVTEVFALDPLLPQAIWGVNGTERPGAVYLSAMLAAHNQFGMPAFQIYGHDVQARDDETIPRDVAEKLLRWGRAALAVAEMRGRSYLSVGTASMGIAGCAGHEVMLQEYLGMLTEHVDMCEIHRRVEKGIYDQEEYEKALAWVRGNCPEGKDWNDPSIQLTREEKDAVWAYNVKMAIILRDLMVGNPKLKELGFEEEAEGHNALAGGFQGQRQWTDFRPNGDFPETILNSSFDWNGIREPFIMATENDCLNGITMLLMHLVGGCAQGFADVRTYWSPEAVKAATGYTLEGPAAGGFIHLINSGTAALDATGEQEENGIPAMKPFYDITPAEAEACLKATTWGTANQMMFRGGGFSSTFYTKAGMPMTIARISVIKGIGPILQVVEGYSVQLPRPVFDIINARTDPAWPSTFFVPTINEAAPFRDVYSVMSNWSANHGVFCGRHIGADLITLASMLRIPVTMHNIPADRLFRPSVWTVLGASCPEAADMLACRTFGPLYR